jgi:transposase-like protein
MLVVIKHLKEECPMNCPHCASPTTKQQSKKTSLGYRTLRCSDCKRTFTERTGTPFNSLQYPTDLVLLVVLWRLRYKLSLRELAEMFLERGVWMTHIVTRRVSGHRGSMAKREQSYGIFVLVRSANGLEHELDGAYG